MKMRLPAPLSAQAILDLTDPRLTRTAEEEKAGADQLSALSEPPQLAGLGSLVQCLKVHD